MASMPPISNPPEAYMTIITPLIASARGFLENGEKLAPVAFVGNLTTQQIIPVILDPTSDDNKEKSAVVVKRTAAMLEADFVFMVMEAWSLRPDKLNKFNAIMEKYGSIGNSPYAIDVVMLSLETRYGVWVTRLPIKPKGYSKKKRTFGQPAFQLFTETRGRFVDLLPLKDGKTAILH